MDRHPGGAKIVIQNCGKDATALFKSLHPPNTIEENLPPEAKVGMVDPSELDALMSSSNGVNQDMEAKIKKAREEMMGVDGMVNLDDFEVSQIAIGVEALLMTDCSYRNRNWRIKSLRQQLWHTTLLVPMTNGQCMRTEVPIAAFASDPASFEKSEQ
ncbi:hypothetical protein QFC24_001061 [Naganishia onofrii]|uniref:Uncharacterized protein n=1 Tax=Naganishia onofrii TaxID=1851511 RepID=A0ACC2XW75_9TREE|nr:hypothetical protein QFC24_001061 [Naganishia onofrii]